VSFDNGKDDFWDLDKLVPRKRPSASRFVTVKRTEEHRIDAITEVGKEHEIRKEERRLTFEGLKSESVSIDKEYTYPESSLIRKVRVIKLTEKFDFYGNFRKAALLYFDAQGEKCDFAAYYSYLPQFSQLTLEQKKYYFYWRSSVRSGHYIKCDYSYLYLYIFEIINLPDKIPPSDGIRQICRLWREYRAALPRIDSRLSSWVQDYCLIHNVPCPMDIISDFVFDAITSSSFKEFYISDTQGEMLGEGTEAVIAYLSDYDWHRAKGAGGETGEVYRKHMLGAMKTVVEMLIERGWLAKGGTPSVIKREAFPGTLCTHAIKRRLEVEYVSLSEGQELRATVTAAVRYAENKIRALTGTKSRLAVRELPEWVKAAVDDYFMGIVKKEKESRRIIPEYEKLYDIPHQVLSISDADDIEKLSWDITARLVEDTEGAEQSFADGVPTDAESENALCNAVGEEGDDEVTVNLTDGLLLEDVRALKMIFDGKDFNLDEAAMERINEFFLNGELGDVVLQPSDEGIILIEDYIEEIGEWLRKTTR